MDCHVGASPLLAMTSTMRLFQGIFIGLTCLSLSSLFSLLSSLFPFSVSCHPNGCPRHLFFLSFPFWASIRGKKGIVLAAIHNKWANGGLSLNTLFQQPIAREKSKGLCWPGRALSRWRHVASEKSGVTRTVIGITNWDHRGPSTRNQESGQRLWWCLWRRGWVIEVRR